MQGANPCLSKMVTRYEEKIIERDGVLHDCEFGQLVCSNQNNDIENKIFGKSEEQK